MKFQGLDDLEKLINNICCLYFEIGYSVKEIILPIEWYEVFSQHSELVSKLKGNHREYDSDTGLILLFPSQSRHLQVIISPYKE